MFNVSNDFINNIQEYGKMLHLQVVLSDGTVYSGSDIVSVNPHYEGKMFSSVMKCIEIELDGVKPDDIIANGVTSVKFGVTVDDSEPLYEIEWKDYIIHEKNYSDNNNSTVLICYDKMITAMIPFVLNLENVTALEALKTVCNTLNLSLTNEDFVGNDIVLYQNLYFTDKDNNNSEFTYRDFFDDIAEISGSIIFVNGNDLVIKKPITAKYPDNNNSVVYSASNMSKIKLGEHIKPINSVVFSRAPQEDNVYVQDEESVALNGLSEFRIENNQIIEHLRTDMHYDDTFEVITNQIFNAIKGFECYCYDFTSYGYCFLDVGDKFFLETIDGTKYPVIMLNNDLIIGQSLSEQSYYGKPEQEKANYQAASKTDRLLNKTSMLVDKIKGEITAVVEKNEQNESRISTIEQDSEQFKVSISKIEGVTEQKDDAGNNLFDENGNPLYKVSGVKTGKEFTFDDEGLAITGNAKSKTKIDETGISVNNEDDEQLLFAGYNEKNGQSIVETQNLTVLTYLIVGKNTRFEDYEDSRTGCFYLN